MPLPTVEGTLHAPSIRVDPTLIARLQTPGRGTTDTPALAKAQAEAELNVLKDGLERQRHALDQALDDRLVSLKGYYAAQTALETREIDAEIARTRAALAKQQRNAASGSEAATQNKARAEVAKLEGDLILLNNQRTDIEVANERKAADAERALRDELTNVRAELLGLTGTATSADPFKAQFLSIRPVLLSASPCVKILKSASTKISAIENQQVTRGLFKRLDSVIA
jgi:hypothetical protein